MSGRKDQHSADDSQNRERAIKLFSYLRELAKLRTKTIRTIDQYDTVLWFNDIPREPECHCIAWKPVEDEEEAEVWLEIRKPSLKPPPNPPKILEPWLDLTQLNDSSKDFPGLNERIVDPSDLEREDDREGKEPARFLSLDEHPEIKQQWEKYVEEKWWPWAEKDRRLQTVQKVYTDLFSIYQKQQRLGEAYEVVLGLGYLTWKPKGSYEVKRHLVVAQTSLTFHAARGAIILGPAGEGAKPTLEEDMLEPHERPDATVEKAIVLQIEEIGDFLWDGVQVVSALKSWIHAVSPDGLYENTTTPQPECGPNPKVNFAPAVVLRKRTERSFIRAFGEIIEQLRAGQSIPTGVIRIVTIVEDARKPPDLEARDDQDIKQPLSLEEIYFPLEVNNEQLEITKRLATRQGLLVQGPPGTGKSHTIANLVCHLLARGKRVLVTSHTARALKVLREKIPKPVSELCVILLGDDLTAMESLEDSVRAITDRYTSWDEKGNQGLIRKLEIKLDAYRKQNASIQKDLRAIRESETYQHPLLFETYKGTAAIIAKRLKEEEEKYSWISTEPEEETKPPLTDGEATGLLRLSREINKSRENEIQKVFPEPNSLISPKEFFELITKEREALNQYQNASSQRRHPAYASLSKADRDQRKALFLSISDLLEIFNTVSNYIQPWVRKAANQILGGQDLAWSELLKVTKDLDTVGDRVRRVAGLKVAGLGEHETAKIKSDARNLIQHLEAGGKLGFGPFRSKVVKEAKYLIREVRVNGNSCDNPQSLRNLIEWIKIADHLDLLGKHWSICTDPPSGPFDTQVAEYHDLCKPLGKALELKEIIVGLKKKIAVIQGLAEPNWRDLEELKAIKQAINAVTLEKYLAAFQGKLQDLETQIHVMAMKSKAHSAVHQLLNAVRERDERSYDAAYTILDGLVKSRREFEIRNDLLGRLKAVAPELALELRSSYEDSVWNTRMGHFSAAWNWGRANRWLKKLNEPHIYETLANNLESCKSRMCNIILDLTQAKAWRHCFSRLTEYDRQHLMAWTKAVRRIGKGTGKYASMHRREARKHMEECRSAIPAWIMPIYRVAETIRPGKDAFDVVIVDEASQSGPEALFLHFLAKQIVVVGDDKQISPEFIGITREDVELLRQRYLSGIPHSDALGVDNSFFDQAEIRYPGRIRLREHFRCMPEIIQFSNNLCYGSEPLIPLRQYAAGRLSPVIVTHYVSDGYQKGTSPRVVNPPEAEAIVDKISRCCEDPAYDSKTMGVISLLGQDQARSMERLLLDEIGPEEMEKRNLVCGDAYAFQGDERDIMFLSLVSAPTEGQRIGTLASPRDARRFNVAASRAKDQMWLFHSVTLSDLSPRCLRYQLLEYCQNPKVQPTSLERLDLGKLREISRLADRDRVSPPEPFESWFELDVFLKIVEHRYRVIPQFEVAGYFIDLVVEGMEGRLAVECDGDEWHGLERYEQDQARQRQLERCGWTFWRVPGSTFYRDPEEALEGLWQVLKRLKIYPESEESESVSEGGPSRAEEHSSATKSEPSPDDESQIDSESAKERLVEKEVTAQQEKEGEVGEETREKPVQQELFRGTTEKKEKERAESVKRRKGGEISRKSEEKTKVAKKGVTRIDPSDLVDPLPHILFNLLPEHEWKCGKCGRIRQILIGLFGPYLKCSNRKCRKTKKIAHAILTEAFHILQIPCAECGSPMVVTIGNAGLPLDRCSQFPKCKAVESWIDLNKRIKQKDVRLQLGDKM